MYLFLDTEFTGLRKGTTLISIAFVAEDCRYFYAELTDYDRCQVDGWIRQHVIQHLLWPDGDVFTTRLVDGEKWSVMMRGAKDAVATELRSWLSQFVSVYVVGDVPAFDWVLFCDLFGGALSLPAPVYYIPLDIATMAFCCGLDPDFSRTDYAGFGSKGGRHNALEDAEVIRGCYRKMKS